MAKTQVVKVEDISRLKGKDRIRNEIIQLIESKKLPFYTIEIDEE